MKIIPSATSVVVLSLIAFFQIGECLDFGNTVRLGTFKVTGKINNVELEIEKDEYGNAVYDGGKLRMHTVGTDNNDSEKLQVTIEFGDQEDTYWLKCVKNSNGSAPCELKAVHTSSFTDAGWDESKNLLKIESKEGQSPKFSFGFKKDGKVMGFIKQLFNKMGPSNDNDD